MPKKKLLRYKDGSVYVSTPTLSFLPARVEPVEEIDLSEATDEEIRELRKNSRRQDILDRVKNRGLHKKNKADVQ